VMSQDIEDTPNLRQGSGCPVLRGVPGGGRGRRLERCLALRTVAI
jgi:hypothetical protein